MVLSTAEVATVLVRDLHVGGSEQVHLVGYALHLTRTAITDPARKIDNPPGQLGVHTLQVHDYRLLPLKPVSHLLDVIERLRSNRRRFGSGCRLEGPDSTR